MQISALTQHFFIGEFELEPVMLKASHECRVITLDAQNMRSVNFRGSKRLQDEPDPHLTFKQHMFPPHSERSQFSLSI
jgi:hypothetical protein